MMKYLNIILTIGVLSAFPPIFGSTIVAQQSTNYYHQKDTNFNIVVASDWDCDENAQGTATS
jgi:hypothetical protein